MSILALINGSMLIFKYNWITHPNIAVWVKVWFECPYQKQLLLCHYTVTKTAHTWLQIYYFYNKYIGKNEIYADFYGILFLSIDETTANFQPVLALQVFIHVKGSSLKETKHVCKKDRAKVGRDIMQWDKVLCWKPSFIYLVKDCWLWMWL